MHKALLATISSLFVFFSTAQQSTYKALDPKHPIQFKGKYIVYQKDTISLGPRALFVDGQLSDTEIAGQPFVYNSATKALDHLQDGTEQQPMVLYIAPYVYWIDNPDDSAIRVAADGGSPYGKIVKCEWLKFHGLTNNPENVVLACNRGQTIGAQGNFTMFRFIGQGTGSENITFGNYCNIDLVFPLLPRLNRPKRASAIVQAQLIHCNGDKIVARNTRFVSRLNLCPFTGGKRVLFDRCHFESTDDALCGTGVYLDCSLDVYGSKPFYSTSGTGAVFLNCMINSFVRDEQFFTKANGKVAVVDTRFKTLPGTYLGWRDVLPLETRNYQYNIVQNGKGAVIGKNNPSSTIDMTGRGVLAAYRLLHDGKIVYNTYNLLAGDDDWDPMRVKQLVIEAEKEINKKLTNLPVQMLVFSTSATIETGKDTAVLTAKRMRFGNFAYSGEPVQWKVANEYKNLVRLEVSEGGLSCKVIPANNNDEKRKVVVVASDASGLEAASLLTVSPAILAPPAFASQPKINPSVNGKLRLDYQLDALYKDESIVTWYRSSDAMGNDAIEVAVSRFDKPFVDYTLTTGDIGYYLMAEVAPKHIRSGAGKSVRFVLPERIVAADVRTNAKVLSTDFSNTSTRNQPKVLPGFWTWEQLQSSSNETGNTGPARDAWYYGEGVDGAANLTGLLQGRSAAMRYTPVGENFSDMELTMTVAPFKAAGQGFSVAHLYMDVLLKLDTRTMTGYGLRFIRTTKHHDAVDCILVKYEDGKAIMISEPVTTTSYKTPCTIKLNVSGNKLSAHVTTLARRDPGPARANMVHEVIMEGTIVPGKYGGIGIQYNGGSPTLIKTLKVRWN
ncbi:hypothetical protein EXU57_00455 [Segetibacter sp. 3557_3]|uniref:hypothetical protein n=1 Tax=Segetibacter sp. 3557_3 TaxID=2547429 RepID=UPI001058AFCC|nr:hypothetical protein [Segetibacter sp. 3557_3]TDH28583.1 hypothetical protein EXU57_00455 [Segetibacter sp. 3557_3]